MNGDAIPTLNGYAFDKQLESTNQGLLRGASVPVNLLQLGGGLKLDASRPRRFRRGSECPSDGMRLDMSRLRRFRTGSECPSDGLWLEQRGSAFRLGGSSLIAGSVLTLQNEAVSYPYGIEDFTSLIDCMKRVFSDCLYFPFSLYMIQSWIGVLSAIARPLDMISFSAAALYSQ